MPRNPDLGQISDGAYNYRKKIISGLGATTTLKKLDSNSIILLDKADGIVITLPTAKPGLVFDFMASVTLTSNNYKIITAAGTELLTGCVISDDSDSGDAVAIFPANGSTHVAITMNGTTTGGIKGTRLRFTCLSSTLWLVEGINVGSSTVANPFTTS